MSDDTGKPSMSPITDPLAAVVYPAFFQMLQSAVHQISKVPRPIGVDALTMREVIRYFVSERPADPCVDHGALLVRRRLRTSFRRRVTLCFQVFVDANHMPCSNPAGEVYGRAMVVRRFDPELSAHLAKHDLVIFP
ncbi:hypothetical protein ABT297_34210 [Dactylosporangium sp. NPDC000555]|uniref:hypothetical protein n=1 Tax=Dactylosporangium sp. NPDC000555 TaxID=3154260 RepID=UPI00332C37CF